MARGDEAFTLLKVPDTLPLIFASKKQMILGTNFISSFVAELLLEGPKSFLSTTWI